MRVIGTLAMAMLIGISLVMAQKPDDATRKLWYTAFIASSNTRRPSKRRANYRIATPNVPVENVAPDTVVGVTSTPLQNRLDKLALTNTTWQSKKATGDSSGDLCPEWRAILDNLRNFFLSPPAEMLSFFQQLRGISQWRNN